jgi:hypothetical protein
MDTTFTWEEKAEELRRKGYHLIIEEYGGGMQPNDEGDNDRWVASIDGEGRRYASTIQGAVEAMYKWIFKGTQKIFVKLTYFKESGKYYSEGTCYVEHRPLNEIWEDIKNMEILPGLAGNWPNGFILINVPDHEHSHPHLIVRKGI